MRTGKEGEDWYIYIYIPTQLEIEISLSSKEVLSRCCDCCCRLCVMFDGSIMLLRPSNLDLASDGCVYEKGLYDFDYS